VTRAHVQYNVTNVAGSDLECPSCMVRNLVVLELLACAGYWRCRSSCLSVLQLLRPAPSCKSQIGTVMGKCKAVPFADLRVVMCQPCVRDRLDASFLSVVLQGVQLGPSSRILQSYTVIGVVIT
jgi:hypothetical protein